VEWKGLERKGKAHFQDSTKDRTGPEGSGLEWTGRERPIFHASTVERRGGDRSGKEGIGLDGFSFRASTKDRTGVERNGREWIGEALLCFNLGREHERYD
jgi:hypothetical protein